MRLVQLHHAIHGRKIAKVEGPFLFLLYAYDSIYDLSNYVIYSGEKLMDAVERLKGNKVLDYQSIYEGQSDWKLLPAFDHPKEPMYCMVSGTGLTHKASAENRQRMHEATETELTDSMRMYLWGVEGGQPTDSQIGVQPEWFYKGNGAILRAHGETLEVPAYADDGGEEPEIAGVYLIDKRGLPWRIGFTTGNEFSDHRMEKKNYLYLAPSKIRTCSIGPELILDGDFQDISGSVRIYRSNQVIWEKAICSGERNMSHSLTNLEYHHFKYDNHRLPGQVHIHFFGADAFSFGEQIELRDEDTMEVSWQGFGKPLKNKLNIAAEVEQFLAVRTIK